MRRVLTVSTIVICVFSFFSTASAADRTWNGGGGDDYWNTGANWGGIAPVGGDALFFGGNTRLTPDNDILADTSFAGITFNNGADPFTLVGNQITLGGNVTNNDADTQTIDLDMILDATRTFTANTGAIVVSGALSGAGGLTKEGGNALTLSEANAYSGTTTLNAGTLNVNDATAVGSGTFTIAGGTIDNTSGGAITLSNDNTQNWNGDFAFTGTGDLNLGMGAVTMNANRQVTVNGGTLTVSGTIDDGGGGFSLTKAGAGTLTLGGTSNCSGGTILNAGTLNINDSGAVGSGTFTIAGGTIDNTSGGAITLIADNVQAWNGDFAFTGTGDLNLGMGAVTMSATRQVTVNGGTLTVGGAIGDGGGGFGLTKEGAGTLTLTGTNTYTGTTTVNTGELDLNAMGVAIAGNLTVAGGTAKLMSSDQIADTGNVVVNGGDFDIQASSDTVAGVQQTGGSISGSGGTLTSTSNFDMQAGTVSAILGGGVGLNKTTAGATTLSGANSYTGGATLNAGTLNINNATAVGSGTFTIAGGTIDNTSGAAVTFDNNNVQAWNGDFVFTGTDDIDFGTGAVTMSATRQVTVNGGTLTVGGAIGDGGGGFGLTKAGAGALTLSGANTYSGATAINGGTLLFNAANNLGDASATNTIAFNGGTLRSTANNTTLVANRAITLNGTGTIQTDADTLTVAGAITNGANLLTITGAGNTTISGVIGAGAGGLTKAGAGTLTLSGANTYTGNTTINAGTARISNTSALGNGSAVTNNATLDIGSTNLAVGGYTQAAASSLNLNVNGSTSGRITSAAAAAVAAASTVNVTTSSVFIPAGTTYTIIDGAGGAGVNVPSITDNSAFVTFVGTSVLGDLILTANRTNSFAAIAASVAGNSNAAAAAAALEASGNDPNATADMLNILNTLEASAENEIAASMETLYPSVDNGTIQASYTALNQSITTIERRLSLVRLAKNTSGTGISTGDNAKKGIEVWGEGFGNYLHQYNSGGVDGYKAALWGTVFGADSETIFNNLRAGFNAGYVNGYVNSKNKNNHTVIHSSQAAIYGTYDWSPLYFDGAFSFALNKYLGKRNIRIVNDWRTANSEYYGQQYSGYIGMGYTFNKGKGLEVTPLGSMQYMHLHLNTYKETEAGALNLNIDTQDYDLVQSGLGIKFNYPLKWPKFEIIPEFRWIWLHDFVGDMQQSLENTYQGAGAAFNTYGVRPDRNTHDLGTSLSLNTDFGVSLAAGYDCQLREDLLGHSGVVTVKYSF